MSQSSVILKIDLNILKTSPEVHAFTVKKSVFLGFMYLKCLWFYLPSPSGTVPSLFEAVF